MIGRVPAALAHGSRVPNEDGTTENLVAVALFRSSIDHATQSEAVPGGLGCWRSSGGREIDFVVPASGVGGARIPVEVKGDGAAEVRNAVFAIRRTFGRGIVTTRTVYEPEGNVPLVPVPLLLAALRERTERTLSGI